MCGFIESTKSTKSALVVCFGTRRINQRSKKMTIMLNGNPHTLESPSTLAKLIENLHIAHKAMAIAVNTQVVKKHLWESYILQNGDEVEILDFVGGG